MSPVTSPPLGLLLAHGKTRWEEGGDVPVACRGFFVALNISGRMSDVSVLKVPAPWSFGHPCTMCTCMDFMGQPICHMFIPGSVALGPFLYVYVSSTTGCLIDIKHAGMACQTLQNVVLCPLCLFFPRRFATVPSKASSSAVYVPRRDPGDRNSEDGQTKRIRVTVRPIKLLHMRPTSTFFSCWRTDETQLHQLLCSDFNMFGR